MEKFLKVMAAFALAVLVVSLIFTILAHIAREKNGPSGNDIFIDEAVSLSVSETIF